MPRVQMSTLLNVPAHEVWGLVGRWNALPDWHPAVVKSELSENGRIRRLTLTGGAILEERLDRADDGERTYSYSLKAGPLPVADYRATFRVKDQGGGAAAVEWSSDFVACGASEAEADALIRELFRQGLDNLRQVFGKP